METSESVARRVELELQRIGDRHLVTRIRGLLVPPRCERRPWDYGQVGQTFPCWIVLEHRRSNTAIAYCAEGFGPRSPWGLLFLEGPCKSMGMDSAWFPHLGEAFLESMASD